MQKNTRIDFHTHSVHSDGVLTPGELAEYLAGGGVVAAALADHNSVDGLKNFARRYHGMKSVLFPPLKYLLNGKVKRYICLLMDLTFPTLNY